VDINGDGQLDILSGSYSRQEKSMAGLFQVLYGEGKGQYKKAAVLNGTDDKPLVIPADDEGEMTKKICTRPYAVDWDGDGHLDLVVGNFEGTFYLFNGEGPGKFAPTPKQLFADDKPLRITGVHSDPFVIDWDSDGDLDIVSGSSDGSVSWAENTAGKGKPPVLKPFKEIIPKGYDPGRNGVKILREEDPIRPTYGVRVWVADINGDGKLDLLVGDSVTLMTPVQGLTDDEAIKKMKDWTEEYSKLSQLANEARNAIVPVKQNTDKQKADKDDPEAAAKAKEQQAAVQKAYEAFDKHDEKRAKFIKQEMTGYVWVYLRK